MPYEPLAADVIIETVVPNANQLVAMDFTPDGRLLYTEKTGALRVVVNDVLQPNPAYFFQSIDTQGERGLLGLAVDPAFAVNNRVWVYLTRNKGGTPTQYENRVVTFVLPGDNVVTETKRARSFPVDPFSTIHNGGNLHFGPDHKLYVTVGNNDEVNQGDDPAQDLSSPLGKIHRFTPGILLTVPGDNPFPGSSLYAYGLRNSFDFDFDPISGALFATENGEACDDEINRILPAYNYGWRPFYPCDDAAPGGPNPNFNSIPPLIYWTPSLAPTGLTFYTSDLIPEWKNDLFMCSYKDVTAAIHHFKLNAARTAIVSHTILSDTINHQPITCRTDLLTGPEGALYYSEGGGYPENNGPIKRLVRRTSLVESATQVLTGRAVAGGQAEVAIQLRHRGTNSNSFTVSVDASTQAEIIDAQTTRGTISPTSPTTLLWSGTVNGTETVVATYTLQIAAVPT
ncbi:MAG TPA: PQQ-dependent sugar dehydrogenase, partial [Anaerolineae bacterium]|nr:PQQ-dependent sugar dehydrogenase [Anaerolineae bacterium]